MQVISGYCELLMKELQPGSQAHDQVAKILEAVESMIKVTRKLQSITKYETREYIEGSLIIDIDKASEGAPVGAEVSECVSEASEGISVGAEDSE